ncbi:MAG: MTH938/NDUFAF3 family protein [Solirubrobacteraceae bacterium]
MARLESYSFGRVTVDGSEQTRDLIVLPDRVVTDWWRRDGHSLVVEDLEGVLDSLPERLIVGIGAYGRLHPDRDVIAALERRGTVVECLHTDEAVRRYGQLDERRTAAALHLTC